ncbi:alpha/beta hydrolase fold domain-containing protein [Ramlibacter terrae]|uniref:Alpha/beta hydrolase fold domain-containing protein n=1 Tax=Ramlibacter terrae TaxID=2732511 RepID=A0ABX6P8R1_9BURK|nr:alpha/beta hydrolase fold domain-containing protein [Ramlibacter terrae]
MAAVQAAVRALGATYKQDIAAGSQRVKDLYAPLLRSQSREGIAMTRDVPYGDHPRQVLDVFRPKHAAGADVVVFVHGGAFVRGAKSGPEGVYDNVLAWFARQGFVGVNVEYRLAPEAMYPGGAQDVGAAMEWVHDHIAGHGGNPARILLMGHSAGGTHVATYAMDPALSDFTCRARALVLASARLRADDSARNPNAGAVRSYFGDDAALYEARSPVTHAARCALPVLVAIAEHDNPLLDVYGLEFAHRIAARDGTAPRVVQCAGHNHMSIMAHFGSGEDALGPEILRFWEALP